MDIKKYHVKGRPSGTAYINVEIIDKDNTYILSEDEWFGARMISSDYNPLKGLRQYEFAVDYGELGNTVVSEKVIEQLKRNRARFEVVGELGKLKPTVTVDLFDKENLNLKTKAELKVILAEEGIDKVENTPIDTLKKTELVDLVYSLKHEGMAGA